MQPRRHAIAPAPLLLLLALSIPANNERERAAPLASAAPVLEHIESSPGPDRDTVGTCQQAKQRIEAELQSERAECQNEIASFERCRSERRDLEGIELVSCSVRLFVGVANGGIAEPLASEGCGSDKPQNPRAQCSVPACEGQLETLQARLLERYGLSALPSC